jgi:hypothetical protein
VRLPHKARDQGVEHFGSPFADLAGAEIGPQPGLSGTHRAGQPSHAWGAAGRCPKPVGRRLAGWIINIVAKRMTSYSKALEVATGAAMQ